MKSVLISIHPKWCEKIASGEKTVEIRKTKPKLDVPFKVYIYETQGYSAVPQVYEDGTMIFKGRGVIIGEFVCDWIRWEPEVADGFVDVCLSQTSCVEAGDIKRYANGKMIYSWHISDLVIYNTPKELSGFVGLRKTKFGYEPVGVKPPQSWCYTEGYNG